MPEGGTAYGEEREAKHYVYDVHDRLIHEYCIDPDDPETGSGNGDAASIDKAPQN